MKKEDITNTFIHLTNVAIQKHAPGFDATKVSRAAQGGAGGRSSAHGRSGRGERGARRGVVCAVCTQGMKWSIRSLRTFMATRHGAEAANELFHNIQARPGA